MVPRGTCSGVPGMEPEGVLRRPSGAFRAPPGRHAVFELSEPNEEWACCRKVGYTTQMKRGPGRGVM